MIFGRQDSNRQCIQGGDREKEEDREAERENNLTETVRTLVSDSSLEDGVDFVIWDGRTIVIVGVLINADCRIHRFLATQESCSSSCTVRRSPVNVIGLKLNIYITGMRLPHSRILTSI